MSHRRDRVTTRRIPLDKIRAHHTNIRRDLGDLRALADSIRRRGLLVPLVVEEDGEGFRLRDGHRRLAACHLVGQTHVRAEVHSTRLGDAEWLTEAVEINHHRRGTDVEERRLTVARMREEGLTFREIARAYAVHPSTIGRWLDPDDPDDPDADESPRLQQRTSRPRPAPLNRRVRDVLERWEGRDLDDQAAELLAEVEAALHAPLGSAPASEAAA